MYAAVFGHVGTFSVDPHYNSPSCMCKKDTRVLRFFKSTCRRHIHGRGKVGRHIFFGYGGGTKPAAMKFASHFLDFLEGRKNSVDFSHYGRRGSSRGCYGNMPECCGETPGSTSRGFFANSECRCRSSSAP